MSTILPHMMSSWCEFRMQVWNAVWLAENTRHKYHQKFAICAPSHTFYRPYLRNQGIYRRCRKNLLNSNIASTCSHNMVNFGSLAANITLPVWGTPDIVLRRSTKLCTMFGRLLGCYIYTFWGLLPLNGIYQVQDSLCVQIWLSILAAFLHGTQVVCICQSLQHSAQGTTYIRQGSHHVGHQPTF